MTTEATENTEEVESQRDCSVPPLGLPQDGREVPATKSETLFNTAGHGKFRSGARNSILPSQNPHASGSVIDQKCAVSQSAVRIDYPSRNRDLFAGIAARIAIDLRNSLPWRASNQQQNSYGKQRCKQKSLAQGQIISPHNRIIDNQIKPRNQRGVANLVNATKN